MIVVRHVDVIEEPEKLIGFRGYDDLNSEIDGQDSGSNVLDDKLENEIQSKIVKEMSPKKSENIENELSRSKRERKIPHFYRASLVKTKCIYVSTVSADSPKNCKEALESDEYELWKNAMNKELNSLIKNDTYELVNKPENTKILDLKLVFTNKSDGRKKQGLL